MVVMRTKTNEFSGTVESLGFFGNIYARHLAFAKAGDTMHGHSHNFNHVTLVSHGAITVWRRDQEDRTYTAPAFIEIPSEVTHEFTAMVDNTECWCIFAVRNLDGEVIDRFEDPSKVTGF